MTPIPRSHDKLPEGNAGDRKSAGNRALTHESVDAQAVAGEPQLQLEKPPAGLLR
jgi:hypothetical protein